MENVLTSENRKAFRFKQHEVSINKDEAEKFNQDLAERFAKLGLEIAKIKRKSWSSVGLQNRTNKGVEKENQRHLIS